MFSIDTILWLFIISEFNKMREIYVSVLETDFTEQTL